MTKKSASPHGTYEQSQEIAIPTLGEPSPPMPAPPAPAVVAPAYRAGLRPAMARPRLQEMREGAFDYRNVPSMAGGARIPFVSSVVLAKDGVPSYEDALLAAKKAQLAVYERDLLDPVSVGAIASLQRVRLQATASLLALEIAQIEGRPGSST